MSKQIALLSPEKYIRTKARNLPIHECILNPGWHEEGIASIYIARKHSNGNITYGSYLVDTWCLGLKDTHSEFNIDIDDWNKLKTTLKEHGLMHQNADYNLVHNIIHGAIAFAEDYGLKPHKDFSLSQFILEEDDECIPIIDIEFGQEGKPYVYVHPEDNKAKAALSHLMANYEKGEFDYMFEVGEADPYADDDDKMAKDIAMLRKKLLPRKDEIETLYKQHFNEQPKYFAPVNFDALAYKIENVPAPPYDKEINELIKYFGNADYKDAEKFMDEIKEASRKYPQVFEFWLMVADVFVEKDMEEAALDLLKEKSKLFPNEFYFIVKEITVLSSLERYDEVFSLAQNHYPDFKQFATNGVVDKESLRDFFGMLSLSLALLNLTDDLEVCVEWLKRLNVDTELIKFNEITVLLGKSFKLAQAGLMQRID